MYNIVFEQYFIDRFDDFIFQMKSHYFDIFRNTGLENIDQIVTDYSNIYIGFQNEIFSKIHEICKTGIVGRKIISIDGDIENCAYTFNKRSFNITFMAQINYQNNEISVYYLTIVRK